VSNNVLVDINGVQANGAGLEGGDKAMLANGSHYFVALESCGGHAAGGWRLPPCSERVPGLAALSGFAPATPAVCAEDWASCGAAPGNNSVTVNVALTPSGNGSFFVGPAEAAVPVDVARNLVDPPDAGFAAGDLGQGPHDPDIAAMPDVSSLTQLPWRPEVARFACDVTVEGEAWPYCPRTILRGVLDRAASMGYEFMIGAELEPDAERNLLAIPRKQRAVIRKALGGQLECREETTLDNFLLLYATSVRNLGTPVFPTRYFNALYEAFGKDSWITTVYADGQPVSSVWSFLYKNAVMPYYAGGLPAARELKAFDFMYWDLMQRACEAGLRSFDFGRSRYGTGAFSFKKNWGFEPAPVHYEYHLPTGRALPGHNPDSRVFQMASSVWRRLPLPMANWLGPMVSPYLA
jgi:hypothetical protein